MPYRRWKPKPVEEEPGLYERLGGLPGVTATGIRGISGVLAPGGPLGAGIAGGGEALAQIIESLGGLGLEQNMGQRLSRVATEAGIGAIPLAKLFKSGKVLGNIARGGIVSGAGDVARQVAEEGIPQEFEDIDLSRAATAAAIGGSAGAAGQKLIDYFTGVQPPKAPTRSPYIVEQTAQPGGAVLVPKGKPNKKGEYPAYERADVGPNWSIEPSATGSPGGTRRHVATPTTSTARVPTAPVSKPKKTSLAEMFFQQLEQETGGAAPAVAPWEDVSDWGNVPGRGTKRVPIRGEQGITPREQRTLDAETRRAREVTRDEAAKLKLEQTQREAELARERAKVIKASGALPEHSLSERASRINAEGARETVSTRWSVPEKEDAGNVPLSDLLGGGGGGPKPEPPPAGKKFADFIREEDLDEVLPQGTMGRDVYDVARTAGLSHDDAVKILAGGVAPKNTALARREPPGGALARREGAGPGVHVPKDYIDAEFTVEQASPMQKLLTGKVKQPRPRKKGTQIPQMPEGWPGPEQIIRQSSTFYDDEIDDLIKAVDVAGERYRVAKLRGDDPEMLRVYGAELQEAARRAGLPTARPPKGKPFTKKAEAPVEAPPPTPPPTAEELESAPDWVKQQLQEVDEWTNKVIPAGPLPVEAPPPTPSAPVAPPPASDKLTQLKEMLGMTDPDSSTAKAIQEVIDKAEGRTPAPRPNLPPTEPPLEPPPPVAPKPKRKGPNGPQGGVGETTVKLSDLLGGAAPPKAQGPTATLASATREARAQAQATLDDLENEIALVEPGSAVEARLMEEAARVMKELEKFGPEPPPAPALTTLSKPRLVKTKKGPDIKSETGLATDMMPLTLLSTIIGGLTGAAINSDDPWTGAAIGGGLGLGAPMIPTALSRIKPGDFGQAFNEAFRSGAGKVGEFATETAEKVPNAMRANLLWGGNLPINVAAAPWGSAAIGGLEEALTGNPAGQAVLRGLNPAEFGRGIWENLDEAAELLAKGEMGRLDAEELLNPTRSLADLYMSGAAMGMASGDVTGRNLMTRSGFTPEMARYYALTGEPEGFVGHTIANIGRGAANTPAEKVGKAAMGIANPFRRTMANVLDTGWERLPGVGPLVHIADKGLDNVDWNRVKAQQAISLPLTALAGLAGSQIDPETAKQLRLRSLVSNMSGVYSLPASLAFTLGMGLNEGQSPKQLVRSGVSEMLPLPSTAAYEDALKAGIDLYEGETPEIPRQMYPGIIRDARQLMGLDDDVPRRPRRIPRMKRNRNRE